MTAVIADVLRLRPLIHSAMTPIKEGMARNRKTWLKFHWAASMSAPMPAPLIAPRRPMPVAQHGGTDLGWIECGGQRVATDVDAIEEVAQ